MTTATLTYEQVKQEVLRLTEYIGLKAGVYDRVRAIAEDSDQLHKWWLDGLAIIATSLDRIIAKPTVMNTQSDSITYTLQYGNDNTTLLQEAMARVVALHIVVRWLKLVAPQLVEAYTSDFVQARDELMRLAYFREMPK